jgi:hypothetical protein
MKKTLFVVVLAFLCLVAEAQVQIPAPSPAGSVSTTVGLTDVKIDYFRPRAKGRKIFGDAASGALFNTVLSGEREQTVVLKFHSLMM